MPQVALIAVDKAAPAFDKLFSYRIPDGCGGEVSPGRRVMVPFGAGNRKRQGMVFAVQDLEMCGRELKQIAQILDDGPLLDREMLALAAYLRNTVFCTYYEAVRLMIPAGLDTRVHYCYRTISGVDAEPDGLNADETLVMAFLQTRRGAVDAGKVIEALGDGAETALRTLFEKGLLAREETLRRRVGDERIAMARLCGSFCLEKLTAKQRAAVAFLDEAGAASLREACYYAAVSRAVLDNLQKKGVVEYYEREVYRNPYQNQSAPDTTEITLSPAQQAAFDALCRVQRAGEYAVSLLYGVTGSGKTQVFLRLARTVVEQGRGVLVLVPEIALTPQTIRLFHARFGGRVAVMHSGLSLGERLDEYKRVRQGEALVVVGTRSAVFAPVRDLGLIIIDEEQEPSYKSEKTPRFHARDVAKWRVHRHRTQLVLASATPSVESFYLARKGRYHLVTLEGRYTGSSLPDVFLIDLADDPPAEPSTVLSGRLCEELRHNLEAGEQSILLLNRRGYHTLVKCSRCGTAAKCPNCSVSLTYHHVNGALCCHYCGYMQPLSIPCACGGAYARYQGAGTQRVEEELQTLYPQARILRMDMDTTMQKFSHERKFEAFARREFDIMIGTQMVAKGLNFPGVTLVGVLCTDQALYSDDFRSFERAFSLLTQVVGRAGRGGGGGRAFIQTYSPGNPVIELACTQQYGRFYSGEIRARKLGLYPPYCDICAVGVTSEDEQAARAASHEMLRAVEITARERYRDLPLRVLGPSDFALYKMNGKYRRKLLLKCRNSRRFRAMLREALALFDANKEYKKVNVFVDMYYDSF